MATPVKVLLSETARRRHWPLVLDHCAEAEPLLLKAGGEVEGDGEPEVAWMSADLFDDRMAGHFFRQVMSSGSLRWLQSPAAGLDHPVFAAVLDRGIRLTSSHVQAIPMAEYVISAVLQHFQRWDLWREVQASAQWQHHRFREIHGTTWLVVGMGAIGNEVASRVRAFGASVIGVRRRAGEGARGLFDLPALLPEADVVVLALSGTAEARGLVDAAFLSAMKQGSVLVNVSRGFVVDEQALIASLDRGLPDLAVLDVFMAEPLPAESPLWAHPRVWVTPHNSAGGRGSLERGAHLFAANLARYRDGQPLENEVTRADVADQQPGG